MIPPSATGDLEVTLRSATLVPSGDVRELGIVVDRVVFSGSAGLHAPAWPVALIWSGVLVCLWVAIRRIGYGARHASLMLAVLIGLLGLALIYDPIRTAFGAWPFLLTSGLGIALVVALLAPARFLFGAGVLMVLAGLVAAELIGRVGSGLALVGLALLLAGALRPALARWFSGVAEPFAPQMWQALVLLALVIFCLRYGGKIYPDSMPGDIGFHVNRMGDTLRGTVLLLSKNRGVFFPYPPALYLLLAPLTLITPDRALLLRSVAAVLDACSPMLVALIALRGGMVRDWRWAVGAGGLYGLGGSGFMPTWWNFSTHIFAQFGHLLLITLVVLHYQPIRQRQMRAGQALMLLIVAQALVYLGHFGFWINMSILSAIGLLVLMAIRWRQQDRHDLFLLVAASVVAQALTVLLFYSGYTQLFVEQAQRTASGGLNELAGRGAVDPQILWAGLIAGLYAHIGLFPIPLALVGLLCWRGQPIVRLLLAGTFLIGVGFAVLPFLTGSTLSTRWMMFAIWGLACGSAAAAEWLWRRGRAGRLVVVVVGGYVLWLSLLMWVGALAWRIRPPEPF
jgi:hypothetical protein